ncbi:MAG: hypothetical protein R6U94_03725 [Nitriliruptoraceae bacterium]
MSLSRALTQQVRRLDEYELRRLLILVRGLLVHVDGPPEGEPGLPPTLTYRQEHVRCGKDGCATCPHGPYWYAYWKEEGRTRKRYIGRTLAGEPLERVEPDRAPDRPGTDLPSASAARDHTPRAQGPEAT